MLEELNSIDWKPLQHAYGSASDVPEQLKALASQSQSDRNAAWDKLYGNIFHQGTRYEASSYAIPFLLELILDNEVAEKNLVIDFLVHLSLGYEEEFIPNGVDITKIRSGLSTDDRCWEMSGHGLTCYDAVLEHLEELLPLIESRIKHIAENSSITEDRVAAIIAIGILLQSQEVDYFQPFEDDSESGVVLAAALAQPYSEKTRDTLIDYIEKLENSDEVFSDNKHDPLSYIVMRLSEAETGLEAIITRFTSLLGTSPINTCLIILGSLLSILRKFEGKELSKDLYQEYSPLTKDALKAVLYSPGWKIGKIGDGSIIMGGTTFVNYGNIVSAHGLPGLIWEEFEAMVNNVEYIPPHSLSSTAKWKKKLQQFISKFKS